MMSIRRCVNIHKAEAAYVSVFGIYFEMPECATEGGSLPTVLKWFVGIQILIQSISFYATSVKFI